MKEGDVVLLQVRIARLDPGSQALIEIASMEGPYSLRVPTRDLWELAPRYGRPLEMPDEDPRIEAAEYERDFPEVETGTDHEHQNYPDPNWGRDER